MPPKKNKHQGIAALPPSALGISAPSRVSQHLHQSSDRSRSPKRDPQHVVQQTAAIANRKDAPFIRTDKKRGTIDEALRIAGDSDLLRAAETAFDGKIHPMLQRNLFGRLGTECIIVFTATLYL